MAEEDCLHCKINELVEQHVAGNETVDLSELVATMSESLADLVLSAEPAEHAKLLAFAVANVGEVYMEKSNAGRADTTH
jgi:hypothetical protein